jgi:uncharacterized protein YlxW (UPF0749 family)
MLLGLMLVLGFRLQTRLGPTLDNRRWDQLALLLAQAERERDALRHELAALRAAPTGPAADPALVQQLQLARLFAGLTPAFGPGVSVTLDDAQGGQGGDNPNLFLLHDDDILRVVNELAAAGAEAISVNNQRLVAMSEIRCAGPVISINNTRVAPPIRVQAIGDPATLEAALRMRGGVIEILTAIGIGVRIEGLDLLELPAFTGAVTPRLIRAER